MNVYNYLNYKDFLKEALKEKRRHVSNSFTYQRMAKACKIQKTYLSRVLNSEDSHLSEDQLFDASTYLGLNPDEQRYLQLLRAFQRSGNAQFKERLNTEIEQIREAENRSESHLAAKAVDLEATNSYYLDPNIALTHMFLSIPRFRKDLKMLAQQLNLSSDSLSDILTKLEQMKFISLENGEYKILQDNIHLSVESPLYYPYRFMQRAKALERIQRIPRERSYNFSVTFTADEEARKRIKAKFLETLEFIEKTAISAPDAEVYQLNFDLFDWSMD